MQPDYDPLPSSALIALALLLLKRARLSLPVENREQAICIIRGVKPAPSRKLPLNLKTRIIPLCSLCHKPMPVGTLCDTQGKHHINCQAHAAHV
jgi:hypothetical protein